VGLVGVDRAVTDGLLTEESTHQLSLASEDPQLVVKRYVSATHRKPQREWRALRLLQQYAPGLAPEPVRAELSADPPVVVMRRLPGEPLGGRQLSGGCLDALGEALQRLHTCLPARVLDNMGPAGNDPATGGRRLRRRLATLQRPDGDAVVSAAYDHAVAWFDSAEAAELIEFEAPAVFARGDHNLANFLLDGARVLLVDFEDSGRCDRLSELAELVEHISARTTPDREWHSFLSRCELDADERRRLAGLRRLQAIFWLLVLLPGQPGHERNPPGTLRRRAERLLSL
jgi:aminoglycoside phosphotransferase